MKTKNSSSGRAAAERSRSANRIRKLLIIQEQLKAELSDVSADNADLVLENKRLKLKNKDLKAETDDLFGTIIEIGRTLDLRFDVKLRNGATLQGILDFVRIGVKATKFDLEATKREKDHLIKVTGLGGL